MKFDVLDSNKADHSQFDVVFAGIYEGSLKAPREFSSIDKAFMKEMLIAAESEGFNGSFLKSFLQRTLISGMPRSLAFLGLGKKTDLTLDGYRKLGALAFKIANEKKYKKAAFFIPRSTKVKTHEAIRAVFEGFNLALYRFDKYFTENKPETHVTDFTLILSDLKPKDFKNALEEALATVHGTCLARDLINDGASAVTPHEFAKIALKEAKEAALEIEVLDEKALAKENMNLMLAVSRASMSVTPPRLIRLDYKPKGKAKKHIVLVGKGVTFDTGGLDLKPAQGMRDMKVDMSGAACVLGTLVAIGRLRPNVAVTGYMACVENGIGSKAYHPGDIIKSRKGFTIEIDNTDAEGRLVLADALDYAQSRDKASCLIDIATLTGACVVALGPLTAGVFSNNDKFASAIKQSGQRSGEDYWPLPLNENLRDQLKSSVADMKNSGSRMGGSITGALFLKKFVAENTTWAHLDIAGPATMEGEHVYTPRGGAGFGVRTLVDYICSL